MKTLDFRSDTVTLPTKSMYDSLLEAELGDDVYEDDKTVNKLEKKAANIVGKEKALFVPSGTMGNLISIMVHINPGEEVILEKNSHIFLYEVAGIARIAGVQSMTIEGINGSLNPINIEKSIRKDNIHFHKTSLICLENTHNMAGGTTIPLDNMKEIYEISKKHNIPIHLDGARIFNAAEYLNVEAKEITKYTDSVMFCLSKGLSAPVGSVIAGSNDFIKKARKIRKMLGGGMRQAGLIASCGIVALDEVKNKTRQDHDKAKLLAKELNKIEKVNVNEETVHTNIVNVDFSKTNIKSNELLDKMKSKGLLVNPRGEYEIRFVTHNNLEEEDVLKAIEVVKQIL